jgi:hypothetical protein
MAVATLLNAASGNTTGPVVGLGTPYGNIIKSAIECDSKRLSRNVAGNFRYHVS